MIPQAFWEKAKSLQNILISHRRYLHTHAETGFDLNDTLAYVKKELSKMGYEPKDCGKAGVMVLAGGQKKGPVFLIRGDMDALPMEEKAEIEEITSRELALHDRAVLTIGTINAGTAPNIIPDTAVMSGSLRTFDEETRQFIKERMVQITEGIAKTFRAEASETFGSGCPALYNDADFSFQ